MMIAIYQGPDPRKQHRAFLLAGVSHNTVLACIPPMTSDTYRAAMIISAGMLGIGPN